MTGLARTPETDGSPGMEREFTPGFIRRWSIKRKLIAIILLLTLFGLTIVFVGMTINNRAMFERRLANDIKVLADIIGDNSNAALAFNDAATANEILSALRAKPHIRQAIVYNVHGQRFAAYARAGSKQDALSMQATDEMGIFRDGYFSITRDIRLDERKIGSISLTTDLTDWDESLRNYIIVFVLLALLTIGVTLALAIFLQRVVTGPISHLAETARRVSTEKDYGVRAVKTTDDEVGILIDGFNAMLTEIQRRDAELLEAQALLEQRVVERTAQLEAANKELEAFSYSVSHDLRAPLRGIDGFGQILLEDYSNKLDDQGKEYLRRLRAASQRMAQIIDDLLKLARVTRSELSLEEMDLGALAQDVAEKIRAQYPERNVRFDTAAGLMARADMRLLRIALENLLGNAWKFTGRQNEARIEFGASEQNGKPTYFVRDNGAGFDMAYVNKLFGAFQRLHDSKEFPGTGIGLATVQRVVQKHGGRIWAESAVNGGATFYFTL